MRELVQSEFSCLTGFLPGSELNARLFHGKARLGSEFPTVPVWCRETMCHFDMQPRRVVCRPPRRRAQSLLPTTLEIMCVVAGIGLRQGDLPLIKAGARPVTQRPELSAGDSPQHGDWRSTLPGFSYAAGFAAPGFWSQVQQDYANRTCTSVPSSLRIAWKGGLLARRRPSPSPFVMPQDGGVGWRNGSLENPRKSWGEATMLNARRFTFGSRSARRLK